MQKWLIGVDEAGRGPLAGPVSVGVACVPKNFNWSQIPGVNDSKKLSEKKREEIFKIAQRLKKEGKLDYAVVMISAKVIDSIGIVPAVSKAMKSALNAIANSKSTLGFAECRVLLDGGLKAPLEYIHQETIIKGDGKEKVIGLASIMAKVTRDRYMVRISVKPKFAPYIFNLHKGYGTLKHRNAIKQNGLSEIHRKTFCKNLCM
jgi:ribonuclease HII